MKKGQSWYWGLRTVCQTFNKVFADHGDLNTLITVHKNTPGHHLLSLVAWLQRHQAHVKRLSVWQGSPWLESTLTALQSPHSCLRNVYFDEVVPETAMSLLSAFQSITECTLCSSAQALSLQALSALPQLVNLKLKQGSFSHLEVAAQCLSLSYAELVTFCRSNVSACLCLQSLVLKNAFIWGMKGFGLLDDGDDEFIVPDGLSALTELTSLTLDFRDHAMHLDWVKTLSALQSFQLVAHRGVFPRSWSAMTNLRSLAVHGQAQGTCKSRNVFFQFKWAALISLERLELQYLAMQRTNLSGLVSLPGLQNVSFTGLCGLDVASCTELAQVTYDLGRHRQDVVLSLTSGF